MSTPARQPLIARIAAFAMAGAALFEALIETDGRAGEIESGAELIFKEALIAEMQRLQLVGEEHEGGRRGGGLGDVKDFDLAAGRRSALIEVHTFEPAVQLAGGDAAVARFDHAIDDRV